jgi:hypothetical protein
MQKRSPWQRYADGHAADFEAGGKDYVVIVTDAYVNARYRMTADRLVDRKGLIEDMEDEIAHLASLKLSRGGVFQPLGKRPPQITLDSKDVQIL